MSFDTIKERPIISGFERSALFVFLEVLALAALAAVWGMMLYHYPRMPESIPRHFNALGQPDAWGSKSTSLILPSVGLVMYVFATVLNRYPHRFNYPGPITPQNARRQYTLARELVTAMKASFLWAFAYIVWARFQTAMGMRQGLGRWFLPTILLVTAMIVVGYFVRSRSEDSPREKQPG
jgi:uncharacterized membrane protein